MITSKQLDTMLSRFNDTNYDIGQRDITFKLKKVCSDSIEFHKLMGISKFNISKLDIAQRAFLAGLVIGVLSNEQHTTNR